MHLVDADKRIRLGKGLSWGLSLNIYATHRHKEVDVWVISHTEPRRVETMTDLDKERVEAGIVNPHFKTYTDLETNEETARIRWAEIMENLAEWEVVRASVTHVPLNGHAEFLASWNIRKDGIPDA